MPGIDLVAGWRQPHAWRRPRRQDAHSSQRRERTNHVTAELHQHAVPLSYPKINHVETTQICRPEVPDCGVPIPHVVVLPAPCLLPEVAAGLVALLHLAQDELEGLRVLCGLISRRAELAPRWWRFHWGSRADRAIDTSRSLFLSDLIFLFLSISWQNSAGRRIACVRIAAHKTSLARLASSSPRPRLSLATTSPRCLHRAFTNAPSQVRRCPHLASASPPPRLHLAPTSSPSMPCAVGGRGGPEYGRQNRVTESCTPTLTGPPEGPGESYERLMGTCWPRVQHEHVEAAPIALEYPVDCSHRSAPKSPPTHYEVRSNCRHSSLFNRRWSSARGIRRHLTDTSRQYSSYQDRWIPPEMRA